MASISTGNALLSIAGIPGKAGLDYPIFLRFPENSSADRFQCSGSSIVHGGYYADLTTDCQVSKVSQIVLRDVDR